MRISPAFIGACGGLWLVCKASEWVQFAVELAEFNDPIRQPPASLAIILIKNCGFPALRKITQNILSFVNNRSQLGFFVFCI